MATILNINVSTPNDGLGDTLRDSQVKANSNFAELNAKKVEAVAGKGLSSNDYSDAEKTKLAGIETGAQKNVQANWNQNDDTQDDYIIGKPSTGNIVSYGTYSLVGQNLTISAGWVWQINNIVYTNSSPIVINFPFASSGMQRIDLVVFNTSNSAERVEGGEVISDPFAPALIENSVLFATLFITDSSVGAPSISNYNDSLLKTLDYPPLESNGIQDFEVPAGKVIKFMYINNAVQLPATENNVDRDDTFTQSGTIGTLKQATYAGNLISVVFQ